MVIKHLEDHLILGYLPENFHPNLFTQCSCILPQFSCFQSEIPVFRLWGCTEYTYPWPMRTGSGLLHIRWACLYRPLHRRPHPQALWCQQVTSPASDAPGWAFTSHGPSLKHLGEIARNSHGLWDKRFFFKPWSDLITHLPSSHHFSTVICHISGVLCLLQTWLHSHSSQSFILFFLTFHNYLAFNIWPKIPS